MRLPVLALLVETAHFAAALATAVTLLVAFVVRFTFHARVVYRPRASRRRAHLGPPSPAQDLVEAPLAETRVGAGS